MMKKHSYFLILLALCSLGAKAEDEGGTGEEAVTNTIIHSCEAVIDDWTLNGSNGTLAQNTWSTEADASGMVPPFCQVWVESGTWEETLTSGTISHTQLTDLAAGYYFVSIDARIFSEAGKTIAEGTKFNVNSKSLDLLTDGTAGTYGSETEVYGTYQLVCQIDESSSTMSISFTIPDSYTYNWLAWKNLYVEYLGEAMPTLEGVSGKMNAGVEAAQTAAVNAYNEEKTEANYIAALNAIEAAEASVGYYAVITATIEAADLDEAGQAVWEASDAYKAYEACTLVTVDDITADLATAVKAQTTESKDISYAALNDGTWVCEQGNGPGTYGDATETYYEGNYTAGKVIYRSIGGLQPGTYEVTFYAVANGTTGRDFDVTTGDNIAQVFANNATEDITVYEQTACTPSDYSHTLTATVGLDGVLEFGLQNVGTGGNWYVCQVVSLTLVNLADALIEDATVSSHAIAKGTPVTITFDCYTSKGYTLSGDASKFSFDNGSDDATVTYNGDGVFTLTVNDDLELGKEYTLTISAGALSYEDTSVSSAEQTFTFRAQGLTESLRNVYLYNRYFNQLLSHGDYAASVVAASDRAAAVDRYGTPVCLTVEEDGYITIQLSDVAFGTNGYFWEYNTYDWIGTDGSKDNAIQFTVSAGTDDEGETYYTFSTTDSKYLNASIQENSIGAVGLGTKYSSGMLGGSYNYTYDEQTQWVIYSMEERNAMKAAWVLEQHQDIAAVCGKKIEDEEGFGTAIAGLGEGTSCTLSSTYSEGTELYQKIDSLTQTVTGLTPGVYKVTLQGFMRQGTNENCYALDDELDLSIAYLRANDCQINLKTWKSGATDASTPNDMEAAGSLCDEGKYTNTLYTTVGADGTLDLAIVCPGYVSSGWMFVKNLTLTRLAEYNLYVNEDPQEPGTYYGTFSDAETARSVDFDGLTAYYLVADNVKPDKTDSEYGVLNFTEVEDGMASGEGYLCKYEGVEGKGSLSLCLASTEEEVNAPEDNLMKAVSSEQALTGEYDYVLGDVDDVVGFYKLESGSKIAAGKAYADLSSVIGSSDVAAFKMVFSEPSDDEATGIESVAPTGSGADAVYDLTGRKVTKPVKGGIYISGGKKVLY